MVTYRNTRGRNGGSRVTLLLLLVPRVTKGWRNPGIPAKLESPWSFLLGRSFCSSTLFRQQRRETILPPFSRTRFICIYPRSFFRDVHNVLINFWDVFGEWRWFSMDRNKLCEIWFLTQKCWLRLIYRIIGQLFCIS